MVFRRPAFIGIGVHKFMPFGVIILFGLAQAPIRHGHATAKQQLPFFAGKLAQRGGQPGFGGNPHIAVFALRTRLAGGGDYGGILLAAAGEHAMRHLRRAGEIGGQVGGFGQQQNDLPARVGRHIRQHRLNGGHGG